MRVRMMSGLLAVALLVSLAVPTSGLAESVARKQEQLVAANDLAARKAAGQFVVANELAAGKATEQPRVANDPVAGQAAEQPVVANNPAARQPAEQPVVTNEPAAGQPVEQTIGQAGEPGQVLAPTIRVTDASQKEYKNGDIAAADVQVTISHAAAFQYAVQADDADESTEGSAEQPVTLTLAGRADGAVHTYVITAADLTNPEAKSRFTVTIFKPAAEQEDVGQAQPEKTQVETMPQVQTSGAGQATKPAAAGNGRKPAGAASTGITAQDVAPYATITPVNGATNVSNTAALRVKFSKKMYVAGTGTVELTTANVAGVNIYSLLDEANNPVATTRYYDAANNELYITPTAPLAYSKTYRLQVNAGVLRDLAGNYNTAAYSRFTTTPDYYPPYLVFTPSTGSTGVALNASVVIKFTEQVALQTTNLSDFVAIKDVTANSTIAFRPSWDANEQALTLTPSAYLQPNRSYLVTVQPNLMRDMSGFGNALSTSLFYTLYDATPPTLTSVPLNGATNVATTDKLSITVSEAVKRFTGDELNNSNAGKVVYLYDSLNKVVTSKVTWDADTRKFTISPAYPLRSGTSYRLAIAAGELRDLAGNANTAFSAEFRTAVQWGEPVISASIANGQTNVSLDGELLLFLDKPVTYADGTVLTSSNVARLLTFRDEHNVNVPFEASWDADSLKVTVRTRSKLLANQKYTVSIDAGKIIDGLGNRNSAFGIGFTTVAAVDLPTVISAPINGDGNIPLNTDINLQFNKPVRLADGSPVTTAAIRSLITLKTSQREAVAFRAEWSPSELVMTLLPTKRLVRNESYTLYLPANAFIDENGNPVPAYIASFSTEYDTNLPKIASVPFNDDSDVPVDKTIAVAFSEDVTLKDGTRLTSANVKQIVTLYDEQFQAVSASYTWDSLTRTVSLKPVRPLRISSTYTIAVGPGTIYNKVKKANGGYIATFYTAATAPALKITTLPKNQATNVSIRDNLKVTFSEAVTLADGTAVTGSNVAGIVQLLTAGGKAVPVKITWDSAHRTMTIDPKLYLEKQSYYMLVISAGSFSSQAGAVNDELRLTFMTGK